MFALSYLAAGRDKDPSMTDAAPSLHSARIWELAFGFGMCRWSDIWAFVSRLS
jgi:hypothetical protein